jgi:hypothetical protein
MRYYIIIRHYTEQCPEDGFPAVAGEYQTLIEAVPKLRKFLDAFDSGDAKFNTIYPGTTSIELWMKDNRTGRICLEQY